MSTSTPIIIKVPNNIFEKSILATIEEYIKELEVKVETIMTINLRGDEYNSSDEHHNRINEQLQQISNILKRGCEHVEERLSKRRCLDKKEEGKETKEEEEDTEEELDSDYYEDEEHDEKENTSTSPNYSPNSPVYSQEF
jgi:hypothetical protein